MPISVAQSGLMAATKPGCHPERSEASVCADRLRREQILRSAQNDMSKNLAKKTRFYGIAMQSFPRQEALRYATLCYTFLLNILPGM